MQFSFNITLREAEKGKQGRLFKCIENRVEAKLESPRVGTTIIDGAAVVLMTPAGYGTTFGQYAQLFAESILIELRSDTLHHIDVVLDR